MAGTRAGARKAAATRKRKEELAVALASHQRERGFVSGIDVSLGHLQEEYAPALKDWTERVKLFQRMGNDPKIAGVLRANIYPLISAKWDAEGGEDEARELVAANLLRKGDPALWCDTSWTQRLYESLLSLQYGVSAFGKTREVVDGYVIFRRLTYLHPRSLGGPTGPWEWDESGANLRAIHRSYMLPDGKTIQDERIPIDDVFLVICGMAGENWEGIPMIRSMYRPFVEKDLAAKIQMIDFQNRGVGIPKAKLAPGDGKVQADTLWTMAKDLRGGSKERQALLLADGQDIGFLTSAGNVVDAAPIISEKNSSIAAAAGTDFQQAGQTTSGSRATGSVLMVNYMQELDALRVFLQDQWTHGAGYLRGPVEELVDSNFGPQEEYPSIICRPVSATTQIDNVLHVVDGIQKGALVHDLHTENYVRKSLGVSTIDAETFQRLKQEAKASPAPNIGGRPDSVGPSDREEPRDDDAGRAFGLTEKKTQDANPRPPNAVCYAWLESTAN